MQHLGHRHQSLRRRGLIPSIKHKLLVRMMDAAAYTVSSLSLFFTLDQVRIIWLEHNAAGVSLIMWLFYTLSSIVWLFYGYIHKDRVLFIMSFFWIACDVLVVVGIALYR